MSTRRKALSGLKWNVLQQFVFQGVNYGSLLILANLVSAENFGAVALSTVLVGLFEIVNGFGMGPLIVKDQVRDRRRISTLFWLALGLSLALFAAVLVAGVFYALFYRPAAPFGLFMIICASAVTIPLNGMNAVFSAQYARDLDFKFCAISATIGVVCSAIVSVGLAWFGLGVWALVAKNVVPVFTQSLSFLLHRRYIVNLRYDGSYARSIRAFAFDFSAFGVINYAVRNLDYVIIGKFFSEAIVGQYSIAYKIMLFPLKNIAARVHTVLYPVLAGVRDRPEALEIMYFKAVTGIAYLAFPIMLVSSALADLWVPLLFRQDFPYLAGLVRVLAVVGAFQATTSAVGILFLIGNQTRAMLRVGLIVLFILGGGFVAGGLSGDITTFAAVYACLYVIVIFPLSNAIAFRFHNFRMHSLLSAIVPALSGALAAAGGSWLVGHWLVAAHPVLRIGGALISGFVIYLACIQVASGRSAAENVSYCWGLVRRSRL